MYAGYLVVRPASEVCGIRLTRICVSEENAEDFGFGISCISWAQPHVPEGKLAEDAEPIDVEGLTPYMWERDIMLTTWAQPSLRGGKSQEDTEEDSSGGSTPHA